METETLLQQAKRPLLIAHISPDGDAMGSLLGLGWALREHGQQPTLACADPVPENLRFLPGAGDIVSRPKGDEDLVVSLDSSDLQRLGSLYDEALFARLTVINIDHHVTNVRFGNAHMIEPTAAATTQVILHLLQRLGWPISAWVATCLLTGLITDTRSFRTSNTDADVFRAALTLVEAGAPLVEINQQLDRDVSLGIIALWGKVLSQAQFKDGVIWAEVSQEMLRSCGVQGNSTNGLVSFLASAREAQIGLLLTEKADGQVEVGLRSVPGVDVSGVALSLGGGGHRQAAGCTLPGPVASARDTVLARLWPVLTERMNTMATSFGDSDVKRLTSVPSA